MLSNLLPGTAWNNNTPVYTWSNPIVSMDPCRIPAFSPDQSRIVLLNCGCHLFRIWLPVKSNFDLIWHEAVACVISFLKQFSFFCVDWWKDDDDDLLEMIVNRSWSQWSVATWWYRCQHKERINQVVHTISNKVHRHYCSLIGSIPLYSVRDGSFVSYCIPLCWTSSCNARTTMRQRNFESGNSW